MRNKRGLSFVDVLIILAIIFLLGALAVPRFVKVPDYGNEQDDAADETNQVVSATTNAPTATGATP